MALNQPLYDALLNEFQDVKIVHEGEPRRVRYLPDYSRPGKLKAQVVQNGEGYVVNCPFCDDRRHRLTVNHHFGVRDPKTRSPNHHLLRCFNERCDNDYANRRAFYQRLRDAGYRQGSVTIPDPGSDHTCERPTRNVCLPEGTIPLHELPADHPACIYLRERRFDPVELAIRWGVGYCEDSPSTKPEFSDRIVIPIHAVKGDLSSGQNAISPVLAGWQARALGDVAYGERKYLSQDGLQASRLLYGLPQAIYSGRPIILCEGVTDCWRIGPGAVAIFGKRERLSRDQIRQLKKYVPGRPLVILLDRDARHEANGLRRQLRTARSGLNGDRRVVVVDLPEGRDDPGDGSRKELLGVIANALDELITTQHTYTVLDGARHTLNKRGRTRLGKTVAIAYTTNAANQVTEIALAGEDQKLRYVATGFRRTLDTLAGKRRIYHDAVAARVVERCNELTPPPDFDDLRTMSRLASHAHSEAIHQVSEDLLNAARSATSDAVRSSLTEAAEARSSWDTGIYQQQVNDLGLNHVYREIELPVIDATAAMMTNGIRVDVDLLRQRHQEHTGRIEQINEQLRDLSGREIDLDDDNGVACYLYDELGLPIPSTTRNGWASVDKYALQALSHQHEAVPLVRRYRNNKVLLDASNSLLNSLHTQTERIYCQLDPLGAATGRFSCESPNLQALPRRLRDVFIADEGHVLIEADFSQIELRVLAHFTQDSRLIEAFRLNEDLHRRTASLVFGVPEDRVTNRQRDVGKRINFAIIYGETAYGLARDLGVSEFQAEEFIDRYFDGYAGVREWTEAVHTDAGKNGYVTTLYGRRRSLPDINSSDQFQRERGLRQAVNTIIQGTAADINKMAIARLHRQLPACCKMLLTVHDSILLEVPEQVADEIACKVKHVMEADYPEFTIPVVVDVNTAETWGDCKQGNASPVASR